MPLCTFGKSAYLLLCLHRAEQFKYEGLTWCSGKNCSRCVVQAAVLLQGLLVRRPEQRLTASKALHIVATLADKD